MDTTTISQIRTIKRTLSFIMVLGTESPILCKMVLLRRHTTTTNKHILKHFSKRRKIHICFRSKQLHIAKSKMSKTENARQVYHNTNLSTYTIAMYALRFIQFYLLRNCCSTISIKPYSIFLQHFDDFHSIIYENAFGYNSKCFSLDVTYLLVGQFT